MDNNENILLAHGFYTYEMTLLNLEEILRDNGKTLGVVSYTLQIWILVQDIVIYVQEKLERILVQEVNLK